MRATDSHSRAVEDAILTGRAESLGDGVAQILVAIARIGILADCQATEPKEVQERADRIRDALISAVRAIAVDGRVPLSGIGDRFYAVTWCDPRPDVDTSSV